MSRKKTTIYFVIGILSGIFLISPVLSFLGIPTFDVILLSLFGENKYLATIFTIIILALIIVSIYKLRKDN